MNRTLLIDLENPCSQCGAREAWIVAVADEFSAQCSCCFQLSCWAETEQEVIELRGGANAKERADH